MSGNVTESVALNGESCFQLEFDNLIIPCVIGVIISVMIILSALDNLLIIIIVIRFREKEDYIKLFILNLAAVDLCLALFSMPIDFVKFMHISECNLLTILRTTSSAKH